MLSRRLARDDDRVIAAIHFAGSEANDMAVRGGCRPGDGFDRSIREFERRTLPTADGLLFVSHASMGPVLEEYPEIERLPRRVLPNFLDDDWAGGGRAEPQVAARRLVTIGRLEARKNHRYGLEIVAAAARQGVRFELTVVGTGPEMDNLLPPGGHAGNRRPGEIHGTSRRCPFGAGGRGVLSAHGRQRTVRVRADRGDGVRATDRRGADRRHDRDLLRSRTTGATCRRTTPTRRRSWWRHSRRTPRKWPGSAGGSEIDSPPRSRRRRSPRNSRRSSRPPIGTDPVTP